MSTTTPDGESLRVLVGADDLRSGRMHAGLLRRDGFTGAACPGGLAGLQRLAAGRAPDAPVTDLRLPRIDGITVARLTRTPSPTMPIFIVTAYPDLARHLQVARRPRPRPCAAGHARSA